MGLIEMSEQSFDGLKVEFSTIDYAIFIGMIAISLAIGVLSGIKNFTSATTEDFLLGGRNMNPFAVSFSLIGGVISALSVFGNATETYLYGTQIWLILSGMIIGMAFGMIFFLPVLYSLKNLSLMKYLELRYESPLIRKMVSLSQLFNTWLYLGICLHAPSLALSSVTPLSTAVSSLILGLVCTIYSSVGGVKGIVNTDVFQTVVMFIGIATVTFQVCFQLGGPTQIYEIAKQGGRWEWFIFDPSPLVRHTFWSVHALGFVTVLQTLIFHQAQYQRLASLKDLKTSRRVCGLFYIGTFLLWTMFFFAGLVAYAAYVTCDPLTDEKIESADQIIPYMVADKLNLIIGVPGLFVAAVYGAVLSSYSSQANACAALIWEDFLSEMICLKGKIPSNPTIIIRIISFVVGLLGIGAAFLISGLGTILETGYTINHAIGGPVAGLFITGMLVPWVKKKGAICGFLAALTWNLWIMFGKYINNAGQAIKKPLSIENCTEKILATYETSDYEIPTNATILSNDNSEDKDYLAIYDLSYCYYGILAIFIVIVVSSCVSFITGFNKPHEIDPSLVNEETLKIYKIIWKKYSTPVSKSSEGCN